MAEFIWSILCAAFALGIFSLALLLVITPVLGVFAYLVRRFIG